MARILEAQFAQVPLAFILSVAAYSPERLAELNLGEIHVHDIGDLNHEHPGHTTVFHTWSYSSDQPLAFGAVCEIIRTIPTNIIRAKGWLYFSEVPERRGIFQLAGKRVSLSLGREWGAVKPKNQVAFISTSEEIDTEDLQLRFDSCQAEYVGTEEEMTLKEIESWIRTQ
jgi:G3E family GTPase